MNTENMPFDYIDSGIELQEKMSSGPLTYDDLVKFNCQISEANSYLSTCPESIKDLFDPIIQMACDHFCDLCEHMLVDPVCSDFDSYEENVESLLNVLGVEEVWDHLIVKLKNSFSKEIFKESIHEIIGIWTISQFTLERINGRSIYIATNANDKAVVDCLNEKYKTICENAIAELTRCRTDVVFL